MREFALIEAIRARSMLTREDVVLGIGDDGAIVSPRPDSELVVVMDTLVAGRHFPLETAAFDVGWKSLAVNLSDLAAMGAEPAWATLALTLPKGDADWTLAFVDGFMALAREHRVALVGGDTTSGPLAVTVTAHGHVPRGKALRRDGAKPGDTIFVSGTLGDAAAGLRAVQRGEEHEALRERLDRPTPRVALGLALRDVATACIDVSDGLLADLRHILERSGAGAMLDVDVLPSSPALRAFASLDERRALQLSGGDDYELCFTVPREREAEALAAAQRCNVPLTRIGAIEATHGVRTKSGIAIVSARAGWDHFA